MKTYKQWCEQANQDALAADLSKLTQDAIKQNKNPEAEAKKVLTAKAIQAQNDPDEASKVAAAAGNVVNPGAKAKKMKKK